VKEMINNRQIRVFATPLDDNLREAARKLEFLREIWYSIRNEAQRRI